MKHLLAMMAAVALVGGVAGGQTVQELALPEVKEEKWEFEEFPIIAWWAPPGTAGREAFEAYKEAGFTLHPTNKDVGFEGAMGHLRAVGVKSMAFRTKQGFELEEAEVDYAKHGDVIVGFLTHDEPSGHAAVGESIRAVNELMRAHPSKRTLFNMLPPGAQGDPPTQAVIDAAVRNGLPILSYDHYYIHEDGGDAVVPQHEWLDLFRRNSLKYEKPFWVFALTIKHFHYRRPSESDLRWMQYTNLAYGAKGLWYFTYWAPTGWENWEERAIVTNKGERTELYGHVKAVNHAVLGMGQTLLKLTNEEVFHTRPPAGQRGLPKDGWWITGAEVGENVIVSFFRHEDGGRYAMVVNTKHGKGLSAAETAQVVTVRFAPDVRKVEAVNWLDGEEGALEIRDGRAEMKIAGGTGVLLRAE